MDDIVQTRASEDGNYVGWPGAASKYIGRAADSIYPLSPILTVESVAALLRCSVPFVRGIPATDLPRHRVAKRDLYLLDELVAFVRARHRSSLNADELLREVECQVLGSALDSERRRPSRRARNASRS